jgi:hypothetical protein
MKPTEQPQPRRKRWRAVRWMLLALLITGAWLAWRTYDHRQAVKEARSLRWGWNEDSLYTKVEQDWRAIFCKDSWQSAVRNLDTPNFAGLQRRSDLVRRLRPTSLSIYYDSDTTSLDELRDLPPLEHLWVSDCPKLRDLTGLRHQPHLKMLDLLYCHSLKTLDGIQNLHKLEGLKLESSPKLTNLDALAGLSALKELDLKFLPQLTDIKALKSLKNLKSLYLAGCDKITKDSLDALKATLPNLEATLPDLEPTLPNLETKTDLAE